MKAILRKMPDIDFFIGFFGGDQIPTKQDKFKPIVEASKVILKSGIELEVSEEALFIRKKSDNSLKEFERFFTEMIKEELSPEQPYDTSIDLEVIISVSMDRKRMAEVDIDNLAKAVMDCFRGHVFIDDSQVLNLLASKHINPQRPLHGLMVGVRRINSDKKSWFENIKLAYFDYED